MTEAIHRRAASVADVERRIQELTAAVARHRRPSRREVEELRAQVAGLARTDGSVPPWRLTELDDAMRDLVRHALPPAPTAEAPVPGPRRRVRSSGREPSGSCEERLAGLGRRVEVLAVRVDAGGRPSREMFEQVMDRLVAMRREADSAEVRQLIDQVKALHRRALAASRTTRKSSLGSSRTGRGFWGRPAGQRPDSRRRLPSRESTPREPAPSILEPSERQRLATESERLRDRAERFAAAPRRGLTLPVRATDDLFLQFKNLRPDVDEETRALNDAAVRVLEQVVMQVRGRRVSGGAL